MVDNDTLFRSQLREAAADGDLPLRPGSAARIRGQRRRTTRRAAGGVLGAAVLTGLVWGGPDLPSLTGANRPVQPASTTVRKPVGERSPGGIFEATNQEGVVLDGLVLPETKNPQWRAKGRSSDPESVRVLQPTTIYASRAPRVGQQQLSYLPMPCGTKLDVRPADLLAGIERSSTAAGTSGRTVIVMKDSAQARRLLDAVWQSVTACSPAGASADGRAWTAKALDARTMFVSDRSRDVQAGQLGGADYLLGQVDNLVWVGIEQGELGPDTTAQRQVLAASFRNTVFPKGP
jgi:hypothetical protein